jgi:amino acid adenylation domain-containing protein
MTDTEISCRLRAALEEWLLAGLGPEDDEKSFLQLGVDSIVATELIELIRREFDPAFGVAALFDYPSINRLSRFLAMDNGKTSAESPLAGIAENVPASINNGKSVAAEGHRPSTDVGSAQRSCAYEPIAVIGLSGRFPGANDVHQLWQNLIEGICSITEIPADRNRYWDLAGLAKRVGRSCRWGGFLTDIECFDSFFFGVSPSEAAMTDPQQRLFLEESWKAIEDAGYAGDELSDTRCGVFAGVLNTDYQDLLTQANALSPKPHELMGSAASILAGRIAYHLNLRGPAIAIDAACSSSLVAIHLACRALQLGEIDLALAGGVTLYLTQKRYNLMEQVGMLTFSGECRPFDDTADGTIPGEGVGAVVLKRLNDALAAGDSIYGVIVSSGTNQAGKTNGITAPSMRSQFELFREVSRRGGIAPESIDYIEAHGTGTSLGDPIELEALALMLQDAPAERICRLGSLKANLGHTTAAAGVAGLIKLLLALQHKRMPPQIHFKFPNRHTDFATGRLKVNTNAESWENQDGRPRRAALNAFGFAGTNGNLIIQEAPDPGSYRAMEPGSPFWILLSARTSAALRTKASDLVRWLIGPGQDAPLVDLSFTLAVGRVAFEERLAFQAHNLAEVSAGLHKFLSGLLGEPLWIGHVLPSPAPVANYSCWGEAWVAGSNVGWADIYGDLEPRRLHLPTYPFARERHWYDLLEPVEKADESSLPGPYPSPGEPRPARLTIRLKNLADATETIRPDARDVGTDFSSGGGGSTSGDLPKLSEAVINPVAGLVSQGVQNIEEARDKLRKLVAKTLYLEEARIRDNKKFAELGLDSILAVELVKRLNAELGLNLSSAALYSYSTVEELASHIIKLPSGSRPRNDGIAQTTFAPGLAEESRIAEVQHGDADRTVQPTNAFWPVSTENTSRRRLLIDRSGAISDLQIITDQFGEPGPSEVQIKVEAATVMLADLLCVRGVYPTMPEYPFTPGFEIAGTITAVGAMVSGLSPGTRVYGLTGVSLGGQAEQISVDSRLVCQIPDRLTMAEACALPVSFITAHHALFEVGKLSAGETVLIHSAASCTGLMAIQLAKRAGAQVFATVGAENKAAYLRKIGVQHVFDYQSPDLFRKLSSALVPKRLDVVLNLLTGPMRDQSLALLAPGGRFLDLAVAGLKIAPPISGASLSDNQAYFGIDCRRLCLRQPTYIRSCLSHLTDLIQRGEVRSLPISHRFALSEARSAYSVLESREAIGRIILLPDETGGSLLAERPSSIIGRSPEQGADRSVERGKTIELAREPKSGFEPVAIIGMAGRFPGADNLEQFWQNLAAGKSFIKDSGARFSDSPANAYQTRFWGGFLEGFDEFDAPFFQIARSEAEVMDPQHRLFLQEAWHAIEDAGYAPKYLAGKPGGIFVGIGSSEYYSQIKDLNAHALPGNLGSGLTGRLAYLLDWTGPCLAIDTACSSAFSAIHLACMSLARQECEFALVGGVHVIASPKVFQATGLMGLLSGSGRCQTFSSSADGWVISEGVGAVMLKRLTDALRDRDHIHGVIRSCGINQDGTRNGLTAPKASAQTALQLQVYTQAAINPETVDYIEAHGLSSTLGDEIEVAALRETFATFTNRTNFCAIGSLKPNIGHPLAASGMAALFKVLLALRYGKLPPLAEVPQVNQNLGFGTGPFFFRHELSEWSRPNDRPRRAAISGLSASGTNCHLVVDEYLPEPVHELPDLRPVLLVLSARNALQLGEAAANLLRFLESKPQVSLRDLAFTLQVGRQPMEERLVWIASSLSEARAKLRSFVNNEPDRDVFSGNAERIDQNAALLIGGAEGKQFLAAASKNGSLDKIGRLWVTGAEIDWDLLYESARPCRIPLPVYPFARDRYWCGQPVSLPALRLAGVQQPTTPDWTVPVPCKGDDAVRLLRDLIAAVLNCAPNDIDADRALVRYGFGSLYVLRVVEQLEATTGVRIPAKSFFECRTLRELAQRFASMSGVAQNEPLRRPESPVKAQLQPAIRDRDLSGGFPLSEGQKSLWCLQKADPKATVYNVPIAFFWDGSLDLVILGRAWTQILEAQPALRSVFPFGVDEPVQKIGPLEPAVVRQENLSQLTESAAIQRIREAAGEPFDLEQGPLWRIHSFSIPIERNVVLIVVHHIIFDGHSLGLIWTDLIDRYRKIQGRTPASLEKTGITPAGYIQIERDYLNSERFLRDRDYWVNQFSSGFVSLGFEQKHDHLSAEQGEVHQTLIPQSLVAGLQRVSESERVTLQSVYLAAFIELLAKISGRTKIVTGVAADVRPSDDFRDTVGFFVNVLPISTEVIPSEPFRALLHRVFDRLIDALEHRRFPFRRLVQALSGQSGEAKELEAAFYFQHWQSPAQAALVERLVPQIHQSGEFYLVFEIIEGRENWYLNIKYRSHAFDAETIGRFAGDFCRMLELLSEDPQHANRLPIGRAQPDRLGSFDYPRERCVHQLIEDQVSRTPDNPAVRFLDLQFTYRELDAQASQLAHQLAAAGVRPGGVVGVLVDRSIEMLVALIAVWKAGAAYVPLDPHHPVERTDYILRDAQVDLVLGQRFGWRPTGIPMLEIDQSPVASEQSAVVRLSAGSSDDLAYVIYTSGSTGNPKGVQISHRSLTHFLCNMAKRPGCNAKDYFLAATTICFDIAALELFLPLITGASVEILSDAISKNGVRFREKIENSPATLIQGTPATWKMLIAAGLGKIPRVKALCGGEAWDSALADQLLDRAGEVWNMYGPTETTIWSSIQKVDRGEPIRLGEPIGNTEFYVFDEAMQLVGSGEIGELYIGGDGLAKGYRNRPDLTRERFVPNPFRPAEQIYRTGDLVRYV